MDKEELKYLRALEGNLDKLYEKYGAQECPICKNVFINCFPFFSDVSFCCSDCEEKDSLNLIVKKDGKVN